MLQLLTATGSRPQAFALCERWMARQDYEGQVVWIIVDDGAKPQAITPAKPGWMQVVIRPSPFWQPGQNTQARNLLAGLNAVDRSAPLVIIEDDDWYAPDWLRHVSKQLEGEELVGEPRARYFNIASRKGRQLGNTMHASLCSTAMQGQAIAKFRKACRYAPQFIDLTLWREQEHKKLFDGHRVVGIKGMPGRGGIGIGHKARFDGQSDPKFSLLRQWIGDDVSHYEEATK